VILIAESVNVIEGWQDPSIDRTSQDVVPVRRDEIYQCGNRHRYGTIMV
jgi:hypothetical protein